MVEYTPPCDRFKLHIRESLRKPSFGWHTARYSKSQCIYTTGQRDGMIYYIESGQVKILLPSQEGKQCLAAIRPPGEIFGELCLSGQPMRLETAVAMKDTILKKISARDFMASIKCSSMLEDLVQYLATRVSEQWEIICALTTTDSEHRLAKTLLHLGKLLGTPESRSVRIEHKISHMELSAMVGTTRSRVGSFLKKFRQLGLVGMTAEGCLVIEQQKMRQYLAQHRDEGYMPELEPPDRDQIIQPPLPN
jgi:CRP/FNR family transcriptional regulator, cyclic AMP receptor protein